MDLLQEDEELRIPRMALFSRLVYWLHGEEVLYCAWLYSKAMQGLDYRDSDENFAQFCDRPALPPLWYLAYVRVRHHEFCGMPLWAWEGPLSVVEAGWRRGWAMVGALVRRRRPDAAGQASRR